MSISKTEIEKKRLAAIEKIRQKSFNSQNSSKISTPKDKSRYYEPYKLPQKALINQNVGKVIFGTTYMISEDRFEVKPSDFSEQLINIFKTIPSRNYDGEKKLWNFSTEHYEELMKKVSNLNPHVVLGSIPQNVLKTVKTKVDNSSIDISQVDSHLRKKLMPFQTDGVVFGIKKNGRCLIADDMGLGKTFQALAIAHYYLKDWPLLIITTSSMRTTWESKIHELLPSVPMMNIVSISSGREKEFVSDCQTQVVITSYSMCVRSIDVLKDRKFGVIILDESHLLKSHKAQSTVCVMKLTKKSKRVILLSGTPALSRPSELYTQLQIIDPYFFSNFTDYGKRYCAGKQTSFGWDMSGQSNLQELQIVLMKKFLIRRTKEQILFDLKEKSRETVLLSPELLNTEDKLQNLSQAANNFMKKKSNDKHGALLTFFCESAKVKIPAICKYISEVIENNDKFIVFGHHKIVLEAICGTLDDHGVPYVCIDGATKTDIRNSLVEKFQTNDSCRCAVLSITAANAGITLTAAQLVIFAELHWNPGILTQAEARAHRIGQKGGVLIKYLIAKGTVDDFMWPLLQNKLQVLNQVGLSKDSFQNTTHSKQESSSNTVLNYFFDNNSKASEKPKTPQLSEFENMDISGFLEDEEGDAMLANLNF